jgi:hypothetical protein
MDIPMGWRLARTRNRNGTTGHHGDWDRFGLIRTTNREEAAAGHGTARCKACEQYFHGLVLALAHECEREDAWRTFVGLPSQEPPAEAATEVEAPTVAQSQPFAPEVFIDWVNSVVSDRNSLRTQVAVLRAAVQEAEAQIHRLKGEIVIKEQSAEKFRRVVLAREAADDYGDWHVRKAQIK